VNFKFLASVIFIVVAGVNLVGCASMVVGQAPAIAVKDADSQSLVKARAQQRWDALLKRDMEVAYQFISPAGRSLMSLEDYRQRVNAGFWRGAKVGEIICAAETCEVTVLVDIFAQGVKFTNPVKETWIMDAGKWWFVYKG
jgi:hypothetical protein